MYFENTNKINTNLAYFPMVSHTNSWFSIYTFCLKYVLGGIIFVLLLTNTQLNCIYVLNLDNMGLAISKNNHESKMYT